MTVEPGDEIIQLARVVLGCVSATPVRARKAEQTLTGKRLSLESAAEAGKTASQECDPTSDLRGSADYKRAIVGTLVRRAALKAYERAVGEF